jgi:hypothetical protein
MPSSKRPALELALENAEAVVDTLVTDEMLKAIPVVGNAFKLVDVTRSISDRILSAKLRRFLDALHEVSEDERVRLSQRLLSNPAEAERIGEATLLTIERANDMNKPQLVAILLLGFLDGTISADEFKRLASAVDASIVPDLVHLAEGARSPASGRSTHLIGLVPHGLAVARSVEAWDHDGSLMYAVTDLGHKFARVYSKWKHVLER